MEKKEIANASLSTVRGRLKRIADYELNELGLTKEQALKLDIFKFIMDHTKNITTSFTVTDNIIKWLRG